MNKEDQQIIEWLKNTSLDELVQNIFSYIHKLEEENKELKEVERQICNEELITKHRYQHILKENEKLKQDNYNLDRENQLKFEKIIEENAELKEQRDNAIKLRNEIIEEEKELKQTIDELAKENEKWIDSGLDYVKRHFKDYIHKNKIIAKIEELDKLSCADSAERIGEDIELLESLLGDDE